MGNGMPLDTDLLIPTRGLPLGLPTGETRGEVRGDASRDNERPGRPDMLSPRYSSRGASRSGVGGCTNIDDTRLMISSIREMRDRVADRDLRLIRRHGRLCPQHSFYVILFCLISSENDPIC